MAHPDPFHFGPPKRTAHAETPVLMVMVISFAVFAIPFLILFRASYSAALAILLSLGLLLVFWMTWLVALALIRSTIRAMSGRVLMFSECFLISVLLGGAIVIVVAVASTLCMVLWGAWLSMK
jgi:hypothetical protein